MQNRKNQLKLSLLDPSNRDALENKRVYSWYAANKEHAMQEAEMTYMDGAKAVLDDFIASKYCQACRNEATKAVRGHCLQRITIP